VKKLEDMWSLRPVVSASQSAIDRLFMGSAQDLLRTARRRLMPRSPLSKLRPCNRGWPRARSQRRRDRIARCPAVHRPGCRGRSARYPRRGPPSRKSADFPSGSVAGTRGPGRGCFSSEIDDFMFGSSLYPVGEFLTGLFRKTPSNRGRRHGIGDLFHRRFHDPAEKAALDTGAHQRAKGARSTATFDRRPVSGARCRATCRWGLNSEDADMTMPSRTETSPPRPLHRFQKGRP
jgi:hypothetical protein